MTVLSIYLLCHRRRPEGISIQSVVKVAVFFWDWLITTWAVLSDQQMSSGWPFPLRSDEQISKKVGVEHHWAPTSSVLHWETSSFFCCGGCILLPYHTHIFRRNWSCKNTILFTSLRWDFFGEKYWFTVCVCVCGWLTVDGSEIRLTSWYGKYPIIYRVSYMSGSEFQPSTVWHPSSQTLLEVLASSHKTQH